FQVRTRRRAPRGNREMPRSTPDPACKGRNPLSAACELCNQSSSHQFSLKARNAINRPVNPIDCLRSVSRRQDRIFYSRRSPVSAGVQNKAEPYESSSRNLWPLDILRSFLASVLFLT